MTQQDAAREGLDRISVLLPLPLSGAYDYLADPALDLRPGDFVRVPLGARVAIGVVWDPAPLDPEAKAPARLREALGRVGDLVLPEASRRLVDWVAQYTMSAPGAVLRMAMSMPEALEPPVAVEGWTLSPSAPHPVVAEPGARRDTAPRRRVLEAMASMPPATTAAIARAADVGAGVVRAMAEAGWLVP
ncbi:MAG: primosomal protein N', partial [Alphaproteobacteria bacterium]